MVEQRTATLPEVEIQSTDLKHREELCRRQGREVGRTIVLGTTTVPLFLTRSVSQSQDFLSEPYSGRSANFVLNDRRKKSCSGYRTWASCTGVRDCTD